MTKISALALVSAMLVAFAAPAVAEEDPYAGFDKVAAISKLNLQGLDVSEVLIWNGKVRAAVTSADGSSSFKYFDIDSLKPAGAVRPQTRVLSDLDVGQPAAAISTQSLTSDDLGEND